VVANFNVRENVNLSRQGRMTSTSQFGQCTNTVVANFNFRENVNLSRQGRMTSTSQFGQCTNTVVANFNFRENVNLSRQGRMTSTSSSNTGNAPTRWWLTSTSEKTSIYPGKGE